MRATSAALDRLASRSPEAAVGNAQIWAATPDFHLTVVGGPNARTDYHDEPYEISSITLKGNMRLAIMENASRPRSLRRGRIVLLRRTCATRRSARAGQRSAVIRSTRPYGVQYGLGGTAQLPLPGASCRGAALRSIGRRPAAAVPLLLRQPRPCGVQERVVVDPSLKACCDDGLPAHQLRPQARAVHEQWHPR